MIASHYAEPVQRRVKGDATLRSGASADAEALCDLSGGAPFLMLDDSLGWAWGYAGEERRVGYVRSELLGR